MEVVVATSKVFQYGKTTIPVEIREKMGIGDGDVVVWSIDEYNNFDNKKVILAKRGTMSRRQGSRYVVER